MEGIGLLTKTVKNFTQFIYQHSPYDSMPKLQKLALSFGIIIDSSFSKERILFTLAQTVITLIDEIIMEAKAQNRRNLNKHVKEQEMEDQIQGKSTLTFSSKCVAGNLNLAVCITQILCPKLDIYQIIKKVQKMKSDLERQNQILEVVYLKDRIQKVKNIVENYYCYCALISDMHNIPKQVRSCVQCLKQYHPICQPNVLICNACLMRFCLKDLKIDPQDPFNYNKQVQAKFFGYIKNDLSQKKGNAEVEQQFYFYVMKFDLPQFQQQMDRKKKSVILKVSLANSFFPQQLNLPVNQNKIFKQNKDFWDLDNIHYNFYLNHRHIKFQYSISKYAVIFKLSNRQLSKQNNILIIKAIKKNIKYNIKNKNTLQCWPQEQIPKIIMIGIYEVCKRPSNQKKSGNQIYPLIHSDNILKELSYQQAICYSKYVLAYKNQIQSQLVSLNHIFQNKKMTFPVRSYGCTHLQCFDYQYIKNIIKNKGKFKKIQPQTFIIQDSSQDQQLINLQSQSLQIIQVEEQQKKIEPNIKINQIIPLSKKITKHKKYYRKKKIPRQTLIDKKQALNCPICDKKLLTLYIDPFFQHIIKNSGFYEKVKIWKQGQYEFQNISKGRKIIF